MRTLNDIIVPFYLSTVSTAGQVYVPVPDAGKVIKIVTALNGAIGTANAAITTKINGTAITGGAITIAYSGSAAGDVDSVVPTAANAVSEDDVLEVETNGASTNAISVSGHFVIRR